MRNTTSQHAVHMEGRSTGERRPRSSRLTIIMLLAASAGCSSERDPTRDELDAEVASVKPTTDGIDMTGNVAVGGESQVRSVAMSTDTTSPNQEFDIVVQRLRAE